MLVATHSGPFHADDVLSWSLLSVFCDDELSLLRTRDPDKLAQADIVFDVGGQFDPERMRFDHHQQSYTGPLSSAGMVLDWLQSQGRLSDELADTLRAKLVGYVDDVDNGRTAPKAGVPCFPSIVEAMNASAHSMAEFDAQFIEAGKLTVAYVQGMVDEHQGIVSARRIVTGAMDVAVARGSRVIELDAYHKWKPVYFDNGGETHPTDYVLFPSNDGTWRLVAIPPKLGDFGQKRSLPAEWAGLSGEALTAVTGVAGSMFCHKNRFIAVFETLESARKAIDKHGLG